MVRVHDGVDGIHGIILQVQRELELIWVNIFATQGAAGMEAEKWGIEGEHLVGKMRHSGGAKKTLTSDSSS